MRMWGPGGKVRRILVVEDEWTIREVCRRVLEAEGFELALAENGREAQDLIAKARYDLYLIDMRTPSMNGRELYQWLEAKYPDECRRVLFTTGDIVGGDTQTFLRETARQFLPKPFTPMELKAAVGEALRQAGGA